MKNILQEHRELITKTALICAIIFVALIAFEIVEEILDFLFDIIS